MGVSQIWRIVRKNKGKEVQFPSFEELLTRQRYNKAKELI